MDRVAQFQAGFLGIQPQEGTIISWGKDNTFEINVQSGVIQVVADASTLNGTTNVLDGDWHHFTVTVPHQEALMKPLHISMAH